MPKRATILVGCICTLYVALRLWRLADDCLWFDEIFGLHAAEQAWSSLFWFAARDLIHPPFFYAVLKLWIGIGGESVIWLRLFSVLISSAAIVPFFLLCRELKLKFSTIIAALLLFTVNGALIKYAQEVRMYGLLLCLSLFSLWIFSRFYHRGKNIWILTIINILLVHTHYFGWLIVAGEVVAILALQRIKIRHVLIMFGITLIAFIPWAMTVLRAAAAGSDVSQNIGWIAKPGIRSVFELLFDLIEPFYFQVSNLEPSTIIFVTLPLLAVIAAAKLVFLSEWKNHERNSEFWLLGILVGVPIVMAFAASWVLPFSVWGSRHLIIVIAPIMILTALFLTEITKRGVRYALLTATFVIIVAGFINFARTDRPPQIWCAWEELASEVPTDEQQTIYAFEDLVAYHLWFATRKREDVRIVKVDGMPGMIEDRAYFLPRGFDGVERIDPSGISGERFWTAFRDARWNEKHYPISTIMERGHSVESRKEAARGAMTAFMVEFQKK